MEKEGRPFLYLRHFVLHFNILLPLALLLGKTLAYVCRFRCLWWALSVTEYLSCFLCYCGQYSPKLSVLKSPYFAIHHFSPYVPFFIRGSFLRGGNCSFKVKLLVLREVEITCPPLLILCERPLVPSSIEMLSTTTNSLSWQSTCNQMAKMYCYVLPKEPKFPWHECVSELSPIVEKR